MHLRLASWCIALFAVSLSDWLLPMSLLLPSKWRQIMSRVPSMSLKSYRCSITGSIYLVVSFLILHFGIFTDHIPFTLNGSSLCAVGLWQTLWMWPVDIWYDSVFLVSVTVPLPVYCTIPCMVTHVQMEEKSWEYVFLATGLALILVAVLSMIVFRRFLLSQSADAADADIDSRAAINSQDSITISSSAEGLRTLLLDWRSVLIILTSFAMTFRSRSLVCNTCHVLYIGNLTFTAITELTTHCARWR